MWLSRFGVSLLPVLILSLPSSVRAAAGGATGFKWWLKDAGAVVSSPVSWDRSDLGKFGLVAAGAGAAFLWLDDNMEDSVEGVRHHALSVVSEKVRYLGDGAYLAPALGAAYAYGALAGNTGLSDAAMIGLESYVLSGAIVTVAKFSVHRYRPKKDFEENRVSEQKFLSGGNLSFPSGHSASAFSTARVAVWYFKDSAAAPYVCYGLASLVAWSRVNDNEHWTSDVVVGSAAGYFVADKVIKLNEGRRESGTALLPFYGAGPGFTAVSRF